MAKPVIAVVDDDPTILALIQSVLEEAGYQVLLSAEGKTAYEFVRDRRPDGLILDLRMEHPQAGWIILHMLRRDPRTANVPVLVCTGDVTYVQMRRQLLRELRGDVLLKPFSAEDLLGKVAGLMRVVPPARTDPNAVDPEPGDQERER